jgi:hypothetical protein
MQLILLFHEKSSSVIQRHLLLKVVSAYNCNSYSYFNDKKRLYSTQRHLFYFVGLAAFFHTYLLLVFFLSFMRFVDVYNLASKMSIKSGR